MQKIVNAALVKIRRLREEIDYQMMTSAAAFESHSRARSEAALAKRNAVVTKFYVVLFQVILNYPFSVLYMTSGNNKKALYFHN